MRLRQLIDWHHNSKTYPHEPTCGGRFRFWGFLKDTEGQDVVTTTLGKVMLIRCVKCKAPKRLPEGIYNRKTEVKVEDKSKLF